jgi:hypothetical protein
MVYILNEALDKVFDKIKTLNILSISTTYIGRDTETLLAIKIKKLYNYLTINEDDWQKFLKQQPEESNVHGEIRGILATNFLNYMQEVVSKLMYTIDTVNINSLHKALSKEQRQEPNHALDEIAKIAKNYTF